MKDIKKLEVLEKEQKLELSTYLLGDSLVFERAQFGGKTVYFSIHKDNTVDLGRFFHHKSGAIWSVEVSSFKEFDKCFKAYVRLLVEEPIQTQKKEFGIPGTKIVRGDEITVLVLKSRDGEGNFILPDTHIEGIKIYFQVPYWDEEQKKKLDNPNSIGKMKALVDYITLGPRIEGKPRTFNVRVLLEGEPISRPIFGQFWTGRSYRIAVDRTVRLNPSMMSIEDDGKKVYFSLDTTRPEIKESKKYLVDHNYSTVDIVITRGEVRDKEVFLYGIVSCFVKKIQKTAA